jgi:hypothetical protein
VSAKSTPFRFRDSFFGLNLNILMVWASTTEVPAAGRDNQSQNGVIPHSTPPVRMIDNENESPHRFYSRQQNTP